MKLTKKHKKLLFSLLLFLIAGLFGLEYTIPDSELASLLRNTQPGLYYVTEASDGDTIVVDMNGTEERIRLIGVDTPETHHPSKPVQCFGESASRFTKKLTEGKEVRLEADSINDNRDRYNRLLRYVYLPDGSLLNKRLIEEGYGFAYTAFDFEKLDEFKIAGDQARKEEVGLWAGCDLIENKYGGFETKPASN